MSDTDLPGEGGPPAPPPPGEAEATLDGDPIVGSVIEGRYRVIAQIGQGGMGTVYVAEHVLLEKRVALKLLAPHLAGMPPLVQRFINEARAISRIGHENIVDVMDVGTTGSGLVFIVMELLEGRDLGRDLEENGAMRWERCCHIAIQICHALAAAHAKGIVHRDLKPENIFLVQRPDRHDFVKVLDFGVAKFTAVDDSAGNEKLTQFGMVMGTPEYMAPEQARGGSADHRIDVYSVGCILYEMLTGSVPFEGDTPMAVLWKQVTEAPQPLLQRRPDPWIPGELEKVVMRALAKAPGSRYQSMADLAKALADVSGSFEPQQPSSVRRRLATEGELIASARSALYRGEVEVAMDAAEEAVGLSGSLEAPELAEFLELLGEIYELVIGGRHRNVRIGSVGGSLTPRATFLLSRIEGVTSVEDLLDVSGMPRLEALRLVAQLLRAGTLARA